MMNENLKRVRVKTHAPLTSHQLWLTFDPFHSILQFKHSILQSTSIDSHPSSQIQLESQGFAFLDQSPCTVIDVNDVIDVKLIPERTSTSTKLSSKHDLIPTEPNKTHSNPTPIPRPIKPLPISSSSTSQKASQEPCKSLIPNHDPTRTTPIPGTGSSRTKARNSRKRKRRSFLRQQEPIKSLESEDQGSRTGLSSNERHGKLGQVEKGLGRSGCTLIGPTRTVSSDEKSSNSSGSTTESSETESDSNSDSDSGSASKSSSGSKSSSSSSSDPESDSNSSAPSSAPIKPPDPNPQPTASTSTSTYTRPSNPILPLQPKRVPIIQPDSFKMFSLSNKNKRKNLRHSSTTELHQASKIVFYQNEPEAEPEARSLQKSSPTYTPASPKFDREEILDEVKEQVDNHQIGVGYGPPPSLRDPCTIPRNVQISWVDVEDPNWVPGQISTGSMGSYQDCLNGSTSSKRKRAQNRKKQVKRNKRARAAKMRDQSLEEEEGRDDEIELEYDEFIKSGGHLIKPKEEKGLGKDVEVGLDYKEKVIKEWDRYEKVDCQSTKKGDRIALKVIELSMESLTPEIMVYFGKVLETDLVFLRMKIDRRCLPLLTSSFDQSLNQDFAEEEEDGEDGEGEGGYSGLRERELIKESYRDSLMKCLWSGNQSGDGNGNEEGELDCRDWKWDEVVEVRRM
ncbi:uncharacterized protein MELLADRAFT_117170 [Melampsora larici-populina 98AG31]|uniref:Uncharacterized protein n=1 Tax=Melampsora larici-populina (strain 98AG31 / pathotype 3-4-7) TaxID=747676 RepID=F4RU88_MELLP|nr:uncharacterized protein MELLADRAFT_117170 [Melampsora larici-populina 98AG31]EGG04043.1 hypothetical protein MELLADRAFT_117170 [Melampsora larici-populina 98AG31]